MFSEDGCLLGCCAAIALVMEVASTSETSENFYETRRNIPEDSHFYTRHRENLKCHILSICSSITQIFISIYTLLLTEYHKYKDGEVASGMILILFS
jgi:hypothetical protein